MHITRLPGTSFRWDTIITVHKHQVLIDLGFWLIRLGKS